MYIGLGGNIGAKGKALAAAVSSLQPLVQIDRVSPVYRSASLLHDGQEPYFNIVLSGLTLCSQGVLFEYTARLEQMLGRIRTTRWGARLIDIDIIDYNGEVSDSPVLTLPHPRMHERSFVLRPLKDIAPDYRHPVSGLHIDEMLGAISDDLGITCIGGLSWR